MTHDGKEGSDAKIAHSIEVLVCVVYGMFTELASGQPDGEVSKRIIPRFRTALYFVVSFYFRTFAPPIGIKTLK